MTRSRWSVLGIGAGLLVGSGLWLARLGVGTHPQAAVAARPPAAKAAPTRPALSEAALDAYNAGHYRDAEAAAERAIRQALASSDPAVRKQGAKARWVQAFSTARRRDFRLARERFAALRREAAALPDKGKPEPKIGENPPSLEEEGAYQHAVLTAALATESSADSASGKGRVPEALGRHYSPEAEAEFVSFMRQYPESPLVHAAVKRIARMHGGDIPKEAEAVWQQAMQTVQTRDRERRREQSMCGPEALREALARCGVGAAANGKVGKSPLPTVAELAKELKTDDQGTTLLALVHAARRRGLRAEGLRLTAPGLLKLVRGLPLKQGPAPAAVGKKAAPPAPPVLSAALPGTPPRAVVALIQPGHFVLVEQVTQELVTVWDPDVGGTGVPGPRSFPALRWNQVWNGVAVSLRP